MKMKICTKCGEEKDESLFYRGYAMCTKCKNAYSREYNNRPGIKQKLYKLKLEYQKTDKGRAMTREIGRRWEKNNPNKVKQSKRKSSQKHKNKRNKKSNERYHSNIQCNLRVKIRRRISNAISKSKKGTRKASTSIKLLGCSFEFLKSHIESLFANGMSWELVLQKKIHLDHIVPLDYFDLTIQENQFIGFNYRNLQPMWAPDNQSKWKKLPPKEVIDKVINSIKEALKCELVS